jgi:hypothetical protein
MAKGETVHPPFFLFVLPKRKNGPCRSKKEKDATDRSMNYTFLRHADRAGSLRSAPL